MNNRGGIVIGPSHNEGGVHFKLSDSGRHIEEEGMEINLPRELINDDAIYTFRGTNAQVLNKILNLAGISLTDKVNIVKSGDIIICKRSAWDDEVRTFTGTIEKILNDINTSKGCKPVGMANVIGQMADGTAKRKRYIIAKNGMRIAVRKKDMEAENPNSARWQKKKARIEELSNNIHRLRLNVSKDVQSQDEKTFLTALVIAVMDKTAERIGNDDSADNGHFGVTGFRKKHIDVIGNKVHLNYVGKSGTKHEKNFSDGRIAKALKKAIKNSPSKFIFETSDGFRIKSDKVNRYLEQYNISAKDMRGYLANRWMINKLKSAVIPPSKGEPKAGDVKERKKIFNKALSQTAGEVGHGRGTLKKHYLIPELQNQYIEHGNIIDMKNLGYYQEGGPVETIKGRKIKNLKVYHGSAVKGLKEISYGKGVRSTPFTGGISEVESKAIFFTSDKNLADFFANNRVEYLKSIGKDGEPVIYERYITIKKPADFSNVETAEKILDDTGINVEEEILGTISPFKTYLSNLINEGAIELSDLWQLVDKKELINKLKKAGYDGAIFQEPKERGISYAIFNPNQAIEKKDEGGTVGESIEEKISERLKERQKSKEFKDTGIATYTRKYRAAYDIITSADLVDIEKDNVTAYKLIEKSKIWPLYNVNELKEQGNSSGAAYLKVKCREFLSARPLDKKEAREVYVKNIEKLIAALQPLKRVEEITLYLNSFVDLDTVYLGDISFMKQAGAWITTSYKGNLKEHNRIEVEQYFDDIFGKKFYNFCKQKSDPSRKIFAEAILYQGFSQQQRKEKVESDFETLQARKKLYESLSEKVKDAPDDRDTLKEIMSATSYYEGYDKPTVLKWLDVRLKFTSVSKEEMDKNLSKIYTVREDDWSWSSAEKKESAPKDEEGKPRAPQSIFEKYGIDPPKVVKRTPLDYIKRTGGLEVGDISTKAVLENFGFKNIIYGNYVNDAESKEHTRHVLGSMLDLTELCNIEIKSINRLGGLDLNIGSTGCGSFSPAFACYFPSLKAINLTKKTGDGSIGHEWAHYLDNVIAEGTEKKATNTLWATDGVKLKSARVQALFAEWKSWLMNGGIQQKIKVEFYPQKQVRYSIYGSTVAEAIEYIQKRYPLYREYKNKMNPNVWKYYGWMAHKLNGNNPLEVEMDSTQTQFWINSSRYTPFSYYTNEQELFARCFEGWLEYKLKKSGRASNYLVDIISGMGLLAMLIPREQWPYPVESEMPWLNDWFERLLSAIRVDYGIAPFDWNTKERTDEYVDLKPTVKEKTDAGVIVEKNKTIVEGGDMEEFEKGIAFRTEYLPDAKGENRIIYRMITSPVLQKGKLTGGIKSDVFIFALKYFTDIKNGYGIADKTTDGKPNVVKQLPETKLEDAKKEALEYFNQKTTTMNRPELFEEGSTIGEEVEIFLPEYQNKMDSHFSKNENPLYKIGDKVFTSYNGSAFEGTIDRVWLADKQVSKPKKDTDWGYKWMYSFSDAPPRVNISGFYEDDLYPSMEKMKKEVRHYTTTLDNDDEMQGGGIAEDVHTYQTELFFDGGEIKTWADVKNFLEQELPKKLPVKREKISLPSSREDEKKFDTVKIEPIPYNIKPIDEPLINIVDTDELRPAMQAIYYNAEAKEKVATDAHVLLVIKDKSIKETKLINPNTGQKVDAKYPQYQAIMPVNYPYKISVEETEIKKLMDQLNGISRARKFFTDWDKKNVLARIKHGDMDLYIDPSFMLKALTALWQYGARDFDFEFSTPNRGILIKDASENGNVALVMPVMWDDKFMSADIISDEMPIPAKEKSSPKKRVRFKPKDRTAKLQQKKYDTIHSCAVRLGRRGGKASAKIKKEDGGTIEEPQAECGCFHSYLKENNPELCELLIAEDINQTPELREAVTEAHKMWSGGRAN